MSEPRPTYSPGPWREGDDDEGNWWIFQDDAHKVFIGNLEDTCGTCHRNATLMTAAPELLQALQELLFAVDHGTGAADWDRRKAKARAAIVRAGEEEPG